PQHDAGCIEGESEGIFTEQAQAECVLVELLGLCGICGGDEGHGLLRSERAGWHGAGKCALLTQRKSKPHRGDAEKLLISQIEAPRREVSFAATVGNRRSPARKCREGPSRARRVP